jgi:hypothetical protein
MTSSNGFSKALSMCQLGQLTQSECKSLRTFSCNSTESYRNNTLSHGLDLARPSTSFHNQSRVRGAIQYYSKPSVTKKNTKKTPVFFLATNFENNNLPLSSNSSVQSDSRSENLSTASAPADLDGTRSFGSLSNWPASFSPFNQASKSGGDQNSLCCDITNNNGANVLHPSTSMQSDYTTDSDSYCTGEAGGDNRYLQITLSSGGIAEKYDPNIVLSPTAESTDESMEGKSQWRHNQMMDFTPPTESLPEKYYFQNDDRRRSLEALKGAKRFFFGGKKSRKSNMF